LALPIDHTAAPVKVARGVLAAVTVGLLVVLVGGLLGATVAALVAGLLGGLGGALLEGLDEAPRTLSIICITPFPTILFGVIIWASFTKNSPFLILILTVVPACVVKTAPSVSSGKYPTKEGITWPSRKALPEVLVAAARAASEGAKRVTEEVPSRVLERPA